MFAHVWANTSFGKSGPTPGLQKVCVTDGLGYCLLDHELCSCRAQAELAAIQPHAINDPSTITTKNDFQIMSSNKAHTPHASSRMPLSHLSTNINQHVLLNIEHLSSIIISSSAARQKCPLSPPSAIGNHLHLHARP
jgi:hypothetical protein